MLMLWDGFGEQWALGHKVTFDGENRQITIDPSVATISVKDDIYSAWKEWVRLYDNSKYLPAFRSIGGDPIGGGKYAGDIYFLINNWKLIIDHSISIDGVVFSDDFPSPFEQIAGTQIVTNIVSSLVTAVDVAGGGTGDAPTAAQVATAVWSNTTRTLTASPTFNGPTAAQIRQEIDANSTKLSSIQTTVNAIDVPTAIEIANQVRTELTPELAHILTLENNPGLTSSQATMLTELYILMGLDPTKPLIVTTSARTAGTISQNISTNTSQTVVNRV